MISPRCSRPPGVFRAPLDGFQGRVVSHGSRFEGGLDIGELMVVHLHGVDVLIAQVHVKLANRAVILQLGRLYSCLMVESLEALEELYEFDEFVPLLLRQQLHLRPGAHHFHDGAGGFDVAHRGRIPFDDYLVIGKAIEKKYLVSFQRDDGIDVGAD